MWSSYFIAKEYFSIGYDYDKSLELNNEEITFRNSKIGEVFAEYVDGLLTEYTISLKVSLSMGSKTPTVEICKYPHPNIRPLPLRH